MLYGGRAMNSREKVSILVADDDPAALHILLAYLKEQGFSTLGATSGEQVIRQIQVLQPDLILLDVMMPGIDGFETCRRLKANETTKDIPVIFITALSDPVNKVMGFEVGGVDYITKSFQPEEVLARVKTHLMTRDLQVKLQEHVQLLKNEIEKHKWTEATLHEREQWFATTLKSIGDAVITTDNEGRVTFMNPVAEALTGWKHNEALGKDIVFKILNEKTPPPTDNLTKKPLEGDIVLNITHHPLLIARNGTEIPIEYSGAPIKGNKGNITGVVVVLHDITERKRAEDALQRHNYELAVLNRMNDLFQVCHVEKEEYNVVVNVCKELFPSDSGGLYMMDDTQTMLNLVTSWGRSPPGKQAFSVDECWSLRHGKVYLVEDPSTEPLCPHLNFSPDNGYLCAPICSSAQVLGILYLYFSPCEPGYSGDECKHMIESRQMVVTRVTEHYALSLLNLRLHESLRMAAIRDPLTDLYNRRHMEESLERETLRAKRHNTPVGIIMLDIDHFKHLNDTYGHEAGDAVLRELGTLFRRHIRSEDIACRYGGEEFLLILPEAPLVIVRQRAEELRIIVKNLLRIRWQEKTLAITISIGVAAFPNHGYNIKNIVNAADTALYQAKAKGRDQVVVAPL